MTSWYGCAEICTNYIYASMHALNKCVPALVACQVVELSQRLKEMQNDFKEVHKQVEQVRQTGSRPSELKADIATLVHELLNDTLAIHTYIHAIQFPRRYI